MQDRKVLVRLDPTIIDSFGIKDAMEIAQYFAGVEAEKADQADS